MSNEAALRGVAQSLTKKYFGNKLAIGKYFVHRPEGKGDGYPVCITNGCFLDATYGRLSNHWYWKKVLPNGKLSSEEENGYGDNEPVFEEITKARAMELAR